MADDVKYRTDDVPVYVTSVSFRGLRKTNADFLRRQLTELVKSKNMSELLKNSTELKSLLLGLQIFKFCEVSIDTEKRSSRSDAYNVNIFVEEKKPQTLKAQWTVNTDGSMRLGGSFALNNLFHRAERLEIEGNMGRDSSTMRSACFIKPVQNNAYVKLSFGGSDCTYDHWWSKFLRNESAIFAEIASPSRFGLHKLHWSNIWREIEPSSHTTPFNVRLESGSSLKTNFRHQFEFDSRSDRIFPDDGGLFRLTQEISFINPAPPRGTIGLEAASPTPVWKAGDKSTQLRMDSLLQIPRRLTSWLVAEATFSAGLVHSLSSHAVSIADRFFMGGPLDLRGYKLYSVGPSERLLTPKPVYVDPPLSSDEERDPTCPVGALASWMGGVHLYSPLPFWGEAKESVASLFRLHAFAMTGSLLADPVRAFKLARNQDGQLDRFLQLLDFQPRYVLGAGLILRFANVARLELNYCFPVNPQPDDNPQPGFQVGVGLSYM